MTCTHGLLCPDSHRILIVKLATGASGVLAPGAWIGVLTKFPFSHGSLGVMLGELHGDDQEAAADEKTPFVCGALDGARQIKAHDHKGQNVPKIDRCCIVAEMLISKSCQRLNFALLFDISRSLTHAGHLRCVFRQFDLSQLNICPSELLWGGHNLWLHHTPDVAIQ